MANAPGNTRNLVEELKFTLEKGQRVARKIALDYLNLPL